MLATSSVFFAAFPALAAPGSTAQTIGLSGALPDLGSVQVNSSHVYDYTFASPPTDWWVQSGIWDMTNRWSCSPGWSWFGGRSEEVAAVWNKRHFSGDTSVQMYFAYKMGMSGTGRWAEYPNNAALTILGDGKDLGTGYTLIIGADNNTRSVLMRNGAVVAQTTDADALLPSVTDGTPPSNEVHRHWWYLRMNKIGPKVECYFENKLILTYTDPDPISSGQTAIWTYNNGIILSRVQIYFAHETAPAKIASNAPDANLLALASR
jgi:hypothetical protein